MKRITVTDMTLAKGAKSLSFKEKIEIARHLDRLNVDVIDMPEIANVATDSLLIRTASAFIKNSTVSVSTGMTVEQVATAAAAVSSAEKSRLKVNIPVSTIQMEYVCHKKAPKMLELAKALFAAATEKCSDVEFFAADATRADMDFLKNIIEAANEAGVKTVTLCDDEGIMLPDEFAAFISKVIAEIPVIKEMNLGILCKNTNGMATASALMALKVGATEIKCCVGDDYLPRIDVLANIIDQCGDRTGVETALNYNELKRITKQIKWISGNGGSNGLGATDNNSDSTPLDANDSLDDVTFAVKKLGYDLSEEDYAKVYDEFKRVAAKKSVGSKELEAIVASTALQVAPTYKLISYVINNGNIISASAQITLEKDGKEIAGIAIGDGPVDASFRAVEQIIGHHFELDDFQIQSVTEGREAVGSAIVRLRHDGKLYSGNGISTDIIGSSIRAYINAVNKIVHEEA